MNATAPIIVGITQRVVSLPARGERRDELDQAWIPFLAECELEPLLIPNLHADVVAFLHRHGARGVILSGGGNISRDLGTLSGRQPSLPPVESDIAPERDRIETAILRASLDGSWPVLGVCRGMQAMNLFHGGAVAKVPGHVAKPHALSVLSPSHDFDAEVNSFHDFGIPMDAIAADFAALAEADGWCEAFMHSQLPQLGIMWHPERNAPISRRDVTLFRRFFHGSAADASA